MTTLKPHLIRADTIDLQSQDAPSAKDHTRQPTHPAPLGLGPPAPHQSQALRHAEHETKQEQRFSPQVSPRPSEDNQRNGYTDEPEFYDVQDELDQHEHHTPHENLVGDSDHDSGVDKDEAGDPSDDDSLDEDLMDKISSSPSIDDGKYALPVMWPPRRDSLESGTSPSPSSTPTRGKESSSSPFTSTPEYFPQLLNFQKPRHPDSHQGEYAGAGKRCTMDPKTEDEALGSSPPQPRPICCQQDPSIPIEDFQLDFDVRDVGRFLLPDDDPLLDNSLDTVDTAEDTLYEDDGDPEWEDEDAIELCRVESSSPDDSDNFQFTSDSRFIDSGWGGECLREIEDIDFEFVYALHTFVATVEGQANATKGDTMVLLDDSNSYWWLVRVVKDGSIGYLPAEHIETPTERLARLNKHRNIDLSATMLGDNPEKSKNPLKKAMRRRNAKTVQFAAPQYFEPSDYEYSDEDEGHDSQVAPVENGGQQEKEELAMEEADTAVVAPLRINTQPGANGVRQVLSNESLNSEKQISPEKSVAPEAFAAGEVVDDAALRSRKGVVRNTDSFYKDDSVETKKISLTPRLLRGDSDGNVQQEQPDMRQRPSLETFDQMIADDGGKSKDDKKKKEKKPGMLSGLFKRKDKKAKPGEPETEVIEKVSSEDSATKISPSSRESQDSLNGKGGPQRQISKLQKPTPGKVPSKTSPVQDNFREPLSATAADRRDLSSTQGYGPQGPFGRPSTSDSGVSQGSSGGPQSHIHDKAATSPTSPTEKKSFFSPLSNALKSGPSNASTDEPVVKAVYAKKAKHRFEIDAADSEDESTPTAEVKHMRSTSPLQTEEGRQSAPEAEAETLVSPVDEYEEPIPSPPHEAPPPPPNEPPALQMDNSSNEEPPSMSPPSHSRSSSPSLVDVDTAHEGDQSTAPTTMSPQNDPHTPSVSTARSTPTWSDASLRSYMDNDQDIRDLLLIVHDRSNVVPAGPDHPITGHLFSAEKTRLAEMQNNLDSMLTQWLSRKNSTLLSG